VGVYKKGKLIYTGKIGTGFNQKMQQELLKQFKPLVVSSAPFQSVPDINKPSRFRPDPPNAKAIWLKPKLICEVSFAEMTSDGVMRHPSFEGMRSDKNPDSVVLEKEIPEEKSRTKKKIPDQIKIIMATPTGKLKSLLNPSEETQVKKIKGHEIKFTNLSKIYWPKEKLTKRDLLNYYYQAAPYILPYLSGRPQSLNRFPNGIEGESFYQKDVKGKAPEWLQTFAYHSEADNRAKEFLVATDEASLLYMVSLGCIEMNPWSSTVKKPDHPDWCIIDLDPDKNPFDQVIETARVIHTVLDGLGIDSYCKTSGSTGIHIYIPLGAKYTYEESKEFARSIVTIVQKEIPKFTSIERPTAKRKGKIYLDFLQNRPQATLAAPYSVRPKPGATVSMPLHWEELKKGLKMLDFNMRNAIARINNEGDIFKPVLGKGIDMKKALKGLNQNL
jgi:bifunctional non-homologous end joining protein LigD